MGVEYIIDEKLFASLPATEKAMWHSHGYEVSTGQLIAPGIPAPAEHALMARLAQTYGKTWHTWHTDQDKALPMGVPQLMMGFTADSQADPEMVEQRNRRLGWMPLKPKLSVRYASTIPFRNFLLTPQKPLSIVRPPSFPATSAVNRPGVNSRSGHTSRRHFTVAIY